MKPVLRSTTGNSHPNNSSTTVAEAVKSRRREATGPVQYSSSRRASNSQGRRHLPTQANKARRTSIQQVEKQGADDEIEGTEVNFAPKERKQPPSTTAKNPVNPCLTSNAVTSKNSPEEPPLNLDGPSPSSSVNVNIDVEDISIGGSFSPPISVSLIAPITSNLPLSLVNSEKETDMDAESCAKIDGKITIGEKSSSAMAKPLVASTCENSSYPRNCSHFPHKSQTPTIKNSLPPIIITFSSHLQVMLPPLSIMTRFIWICP